MANHPVVVRRFRGTKTISKLTPKITNSFEMSNAQVNSQVFVLILDLLPDPPIYIFLPNFPRNCYACAVEFYTSALKLIRMIYDSFTYMIHIVLSMNFCYFN